MNPKVTQIYNHFNLMIAKQRAISASPLHTPPLQHPIPANPSNGLNQKWGREDVPRTVITWSRRWQPCIAVVFKELLTEGGLS